MRGKRMIAWALCAMLLLNSFAFAEGDGVSGDSWLSDGAPDEGESEVLAQALEEQDENIEAEDVSDDGARDEAQEEIMEEAQGEAESPVEPAQMTEEPAQAPTAAPTPAPQPSPEEEEPFEPHGEAWTVLEDGTVRDGRLQELLAELRDNGQSATVYLLTVGETRVKGIPMSLFERVSLEADEKRLGKRRAPYEVEIEADELDEEQALDPEYVPPVTIRVIPTEAEETDAPQETPEWVLPTLAPGEVLVTSVPTQTPEPTPTPEPDVTLTVEAENLAQGAWQNTPPVFTLSGIEGRDAAQYVYGVFICGERLVLFADGTTQYMPTEEGTLSFRFAILDRMGDVRALSEQFDVWLDMTPPEGPFIVQDEKEATKATVSAYDALSGVEAISLDRGETWKPLTDGEALTVRGEKGEKLGGDQVRVRDAAGNVSSNYEQFIFGATPVVSRPGTGKKIHHVKETMDYSLANYNALDLVFPSEPSVSLVAGGTLLPLTMTAELSGERAPGAFSAALATWKTNAQDTRTAPNALVLTAAQANEVTTWSFSGEAYRLLYNSGVEYLVFASGEYMTAVSTAGFTGGTAYAKLKAGGVSTRKFAYTLCQDEALRETTLSVEVEGETYLLGEDRDQPMYRYDVLVGTLSMMCEPFESYLPHSGDTQDEATNGGLGDE